jgi:hypothetical protein
LAFQDAVKGCSSRRQCRFPGEEILSGGLTLIRTIRARNNVRVGTYRFGTGLHQKPEFNGLINHQSNMHIRAKGRPGPRLSFAAILKRDDGRRLPSRLIDAFVPCNFPASA